ncbi:MAG: sugar ABC transporter permease [Anaerolineales bacterium]|nr:sugar ABC transporter permease [Anaerolineales bacterium]
MKPVSPTNGMDNRTAIYLRALMIWQGLVAIGAVVGFALVITNPGMASWTKIISTVLLLVVAIASAVAAYFILQRDHRGRVISLVVNYLGFLACLLYGLHTLGIFLSLDALAGTFGHGLPFLLGVLVGYLISAFGDRYDNYPQKRRFYQNAGKIVMTVFGVVALFAMGLVNGLIALVSRFNSPLPFLLTIGTALFAVMIWAMWRGPTAEVMKANNAHEEMLSGLLFLSPNLLGFLFFFAGPLLLSLYTSFTNWDAFGTREWVGLDNYSKIFTLDIKRLDSPDQPWPEVLDTAKFDELTRFTLLGTSYVIGAQDKLFWIALRNTFVFSILAVPLSVIPALFLANLLNSKLPGMKFFRAVYFLPSIAAVVGVALIWQWLYNAAVGYINYAVTSLVNLINIIPGITLVDPQIRWLSDTHTALLAVVIMSAWQWVGFNTVLFLAGLQNIPGELYEAATVDGAGKWAKFWNVTLPLLAPTTFFVVTTAVIQALQLFEQVYVLIPTEPPGGPNNSTLSLVLYLYQKGFQRFEQGYASAVAWVLFIVIFAVTLIQYSRQRAGSKAYGG